MVRRLLLLFPHLFGATLTTLGGPFMTISPRRLLHLCFAPLPILLLLLLTACGDTPRSNVQGENQGERRGENQEEDQAGNQGGDSLGRWQRNRPRPLGSRRSFVPPQEVIAQDIIAANPWDTIPPERIYGATPAENLRLQPVEMEILDLPVGWHGMQIAALSDFNLSDWSGNVEVATAALRLAISQKPDLIVLLGDYISTASDTLLLRSVLAPLRNLKTFAVLGEEDSRTDSLEAHVTRELSAHGIQVLKNNAVPFERGGEISYIAGLDPDLANDNWNDRVWILATLARGLPVPLLLSHAPVLAATAPTGRFPFILSGNTVCSPIEVPGAHRKIFLEAQVLPGSSHPDVERLYRVKENIIFVTCGIGYSFLPIRFSYPPEVAMVKLLRYGYEEAPTPAAADSVLSDSLVERYLGSDSIIVDTSTESPN